MRIFQRTATGTTRPLSLIAAILLVAMSAVLPQSSVVASATSPLVTADNTTSIAASSAVLNSTLTGLGSADSNNGFLQFTSAGNVLGFREDGVIIASARHMLRIDFLNSRAVAGLAK